MILRAESLNPRVLEGMNAQFQAEFEALKKEAQNEIFRLESILFERDDEIANLKNALQVSTPVNSKIMVDFIMNTD